MGRNTQPGPEHRHHPDSAGDGQIDLVGLGGSFNNGLTVQNTFLVASSVGTPTIGEFNTNSTGVGYNYQNGGGNPQGLEATTMTASGQIDLAFWDVGNPDRANAGLMYASNMLSGNYDRRGRCGRV
jgi:hypothetical protein